MGCSTRENPPPDSAPHTMKRTPTDRRSTNLPSPGPTIRGPAEPSNRDVGSSNEAPGVARGACCIVVILPPEWVSIRSINIVNNGVHRTAATIRLCGRLVKSSVNTYVHQHGDQEIRAETPRRAASGDPEAN